MGEQVIRRGHDTWVESAHPSLEHGDGKYPQVLNGAARVLLFLPLEGIKGKTILSATLTGRVRNAFPAQTLYVEMPTEKWSAAWVNWSKQPAVGTAVVSTTVGALADGAQVSWSIGSLVQSVANGADYFGFRIRTSLAAGGRFYGFDSGLDSWTLTIETSDAPQIPTTLYPANGAVGLPKWVISTDFTDVGDSTEMASMNVQVSPTANAATAWDSGEVATAIPELDLAATSYPGLAANATTQWRARVKDGDGNWSGWSDWVSVTYVPRPSIVLDNPAAGLFGDPSSTISAHLDSGALEAWQIRITEGGDQTRIRYDSHKRNASGTTIALELPFENADKQRIFKDDGSYWLNVRAWDRLDRLRGGDGDPPYLEVWQQLTFDQDAALDPVTSLSTIQVGDTPRVRFVWTRTAGAGDAWLIEDADTKDRVARLDAGDVTNSGGVFSWECDSVPPNTSRTFHVRAIVNSDVAKPGPRSTIRTEVPAVWLLAETGDVRIGGSGVGGFKKSDRRASYALPGMPFDLDIIGALAGVSGDYAGGVEERPDLPDVDETRRNVDLIRKAPTTTVRLAYGTRNIPVLLRNLSMDESERFELANHRYVVSFFAQQVGDFDEAL